MAKKSVELRAFRAVSNNALSHESLPSRIKILDWGQNQANDGSIVVLDDKSVSVFDANQKRLGRERVPLDYNHVTVPNTEAYKQFGGCPTIFAYGAPKIVPNEGLFLEQVTWTPTGTQKSKDFEDISPAPVLENGRVIGLHSCALTPAGAIADLKFYSSNTLDGIVKALAADYEPNAYKGIKYMEGAKEHSDELMGYFRKKLNLGEGTTAEDIMVAIRAHWEGEHDGEANMNNLLLKAPNSSLNPAMRNGMMPQETPHGTITYEAIKTAIGDAIKPLNEKIATFEAKAKADTEASETKEREQLVAEASRLGKIIPLSADEVKATPVAILRSVVANLPKSEVPVKPKVEIKPLNSDERSTITKGAMGKAVGVLNDHFNRGMQPTFN